MIANLVEVLPPAHAGHWLASTLYLFPVFILAGGVIWQRRQDRHSEDDGSVTQEENVPFTDE
jgi:cytochrome c-type biogenesis protein CcmH/NrfF